MTTGHIQKSEFHWPLSGNETRGTTVAARPSRDVHHLGGSAAAFCPERTSRVGIDRELLGLSGRWRAEPTRSAIPRKPAACGEIVLNGIESIRRTRTRKFLLA